jgi:hypothetical protein
MSKIEKTRLFSTFLVKNKQVSVKKWTKTKNRGGAEFFNVFSNKNFFSFEIYIYDLKTDFALIIKRKSGLKYFYN